MDRDFGSGIIKLILFIQTPFKSSFACVFGLEVLTAFFSSMGTVLTPERRHPTKILFEIRCFFLLPEFALFVACLLFRFSRVFTENECSQWRIHSALLWVTIVTNFGIIFFGLFYLALTFDPIGHLDIQKRQNGTGNCPRNASIADFLAAKI